MLHFIKALWKSILSASGLLGLWYIPSDLVGISDPSSHWMGYINMIDQNLVLWVVAIIFAAYLLYNDVKPFILSYRKSHSVAWAKDRDRLTLKESACYLTDTQLSDFNTSSNSQSKLAELTYWSQNYQLKLLQDGWSLHTGRPYPRANVTPESYVLREDIDKIKSEGISTWWLVSDETNRENRGA